MQRHAWFAAVSVSVLAVAAACATNKPAGVETDPAVRTAQAPGESFQSKIDKNASDMLEEGKRIFRYDTFGSEDFWGGKLRLHEAIAGRRSGRRRAGRDARQALQLGLKVDVGALPEHPGRGDQGPARSISTTSRRRSSCCAPTPSSASKGVFDKDTKRMTVDRHHVRALPLDRRRLASPRASAAASTAGRTATSNVGAIVAMAPTLKPFADLLGVDEATVRKVLTSWGPGRYDAELNQDGKALRPDGKTAATVLPAAFGLAGVNLHTYTGWGSVTHWNAYVANTQMHGKGTFFDPRMNDAQRFPVAVKSGDWNKRDTPDLITSKLAALHFYQLVDPGAGAAEGLVRRRGGRRAARPSSRARRKCATCHVPPLFTEPGWPMHTARGDRHRRLPGEPLARQEVLPDDAAQGPVRAREGRLLPRRPLRDLRGGGRALRPACSSSGSDPGETADLVEYLKSL